MVNQEGLLALIVESQLPENVSLIGDDGNPGSHSDDREDPIF
jgi:hypothetical protein